MTRPSPILPQKTRRALIEVQLVAEAKAELGRDYLTPDELEEIERILFEWDPLCPAPKR